MTLEYLVIDLETSIKNRGEDAIGKNKASPYHPDNKIVWCGMYNSKTDEYRHWSGKGAVVLQPDPDVLIVGQNLKFDLHYLRRDLPRFKGWLRTGHVWDIQLAEYLLTGQEKKMASLDSMAQRYGLPLKDDRIKEYWEANIDTEDIPEDEILPYLRNDVEVTHQIFLSQLQTAKELNMLPLIHTQMEALLATLEMEANGMAFHTAGARSMVVELTNNLRIAEEDILLCATALCPKSYIENNSLLNLSSPQQLSAILFGGKVKTKRRVPMLDSSGKPILFKSGAKAGQTREKFEIHDIELAQQVPPMRFTEPTKKEGVYKTDDGVLKEIAEHYTAPISVIAELCEAVLKSRALTKDLTTYYQPYINLTWPDGLIHPQYNHTVTATGRLSSSNPNLQNVSNDHDD